MRILLILSGILIFLSGCQQHPENSLFTLGESTAIDDGKSALVLTAVVEINPEVLVPGQSVTVVFPLPGKILEVDLQPLSATDLALPRGQSAWVGQLEDGNSVFVMIIGESIEAQIQLGDKIYRLRSMKATNGVLEVFVGSRFLEPPGDGIIDPEVTGLDGGVSGDSSCEDPANRIDMMMLYTPAARDAAGGVTEVENDIAFAIGRTNLAYANSGATHRLNLVYAGVVAYTEAAGGVDSNGLLGDIAGTTDGVLDTIHSLRDSVRADLVSLIYEVDDGSWCGWGQIQETANADTTDHRAFTVVQRSCAGNNLSFAHEVGQR